MASGRLASNCFSTRMPSSRPLNIASVPSTISLMFAGRGWAAGNLASEENSSTSERTVCTASVMVSAQSWITFNDASSGTSPRSRCLRMRSAESAMGVSGFLISCATRRATSRHAASRCAFNSSLKSSNTITYPSRCLPCCTEETVTLTLSLSLSRGISNCAAVTDMRSARRNKCSRSEAVSSSKTSRSVDPITGAPPLGQNIRPKATLLCVTRRSGSRESTPVGILSRIVSMCRRRCSSSVFVSFRARADSSILVRLDSSSPAMVLNEETSSPSSSAAETSTRCPRCPSDISRVATASASTGRVTSLATKSEDHVATNRTSTVSMVNRSMYRPRMRFASWPRVS